MDLPAIAESNLSYVVDRIRICSVLCNVCGKRVTGAGITAYSVVVCQS